MSARSTDSCDHSADSQGVLSKERHYPGCSRWRYTACLLSASLLLATWSVIGVQAQSYTPVTAGTTYFDLQQNGTLGRQIDESCGKIQTAWTRSPGPSASVLQVYWNCISITGTALIPGGMPIPANGVRPGLPNVISRTGCRGIMAYHDFPETGGAGNKSTEITFDVSPCLGVWITPHVIPFAWPRLATSLCGGDTILHVLTTEPEAPRRVWYSRGVVTESAGIPLIAWDTPIFLCTETANITATIETFGSEVTVAYIERTGTDFNDFSWDVVYVQSTNCGITWGPVQNLTNHSPADPEKAFTELAMAYDEYGDLHLLWNTVQWNTAPPRGTDQPVRLYHWSPMTGSRLISMGDWDNDCGSQLGAGRNNGAGWANLVMSDLALSIKPEGFGPGTGIPEELIYAIWTQYESDGRDCGVADPFWVEPMYTNADLYWSVSSNGGFTWDRPQNFTSTSSHDCLPGDCYSEAWVTAAKQADSGVYVAYVEDKHAGAAVMAEGEWTDNPFQVMALPTRQPVREPVISIYPTVFYELRAHPSGGFETVEVAIHNLGNDNLSFMVEVTNDDDGLSHVSIGGNVQYSNIIPAGGAPEIVTVSYDGQGLVNPSTQDWRLEITSNDQANDPGQGGTAIDVLLHVTVTEPWYPCEHDTLATSQHRLSVSSCLELGDQLAVGGGYYSTTDLSEWLYSASPVVTRLQAPSTQLAYRNLFFHDAHRVRDLNQSFRPLPPGMSVVRDAQHDIASGSAVTTDSVIRIDYGMISYKDLEGVVVACTVTNITGTVIEDVDVGAAADFDVTSDVDEPWDIVGIGEYAKREPRDNIGYANKDKGYIGAQGGAVLTGAGGFAPNENRIVLFRVPVDENCTVDGGAGALVVANEAYVRSDYGFRSSTLYDLFEIIGSIGMWDAHIMGDDGSGYGDITALLVDQHDVDLIPGVAVTYAFGLTTSEGLMADKRLQGSLEERIAEIRVAFNSACEGCAVEITGDVNESGSISSADIIHLVGFVFKGGPPPRPCIAAGDVNCDGAVTSGDIIFLVNHVFKGGSEPCDVCTLIPGTWTCP